VYENANNTGSGDDGRFRKLFDQQDQGECNDEYSGANRATTSAALVPPTVSDNTGVSDHAGR
jgi:hypothetical protein